MGEKEKTFEKLFIEAVDEGLETLGESGKHMIFFHLDKSYSIKKYEISKKPEAFAKGLEKIFGAGASVLEKLIVKSLYSKLGLKYEEEENRLFADYVKYVKEANDANDAKEARGNNSSSNSSSNQRSSEVKSFQQSSLLYVETEMENCVHFYQ
jgi:hypothetical protein